MKIRTIVLLAGIVAAMPGAAIAACDLRTWTIAGLVVDADGAPVPDATVEARWEEKVNGTMSNRRDADSLGRFTAPIAFDPYSGKTFGGSFKCEETLSEVTLVIASTGFRTTELTLEPEKVDGLVRVVLQRGR
jgi:hypothetical protein